MMPIRKALSENIKFRLHSQQRESIAKSIFLKTLLIFVVSLMLFVVSNGLAFGGEETVYEAENRTDEKDCDERSGNDGFTGSGYMDFGGKGTWVEWDNIYVEVAGGHTLTFRYANGKSPERPSTVRVNGVNIGELPFLSTILGGRPLKGVSRKKTPLPQEKIYEFWVGPS